MAIKALLLDLGNVVVEIDFRIMLNAIGLPHPLTEQTAMQSLDRLSHFDAFERGTLDEAGFVNALLPSLARPLSFGEFERAWNTIFLGEVPGIDGLLTRVAPKLPLYALTNANPMHMRRMNQYPAMRHFREVFTSYDLKCRKPEREIYLRVCEAVDLAPSEILFLDDREENVIGAQAVGMNAAKVARSASEVEKYLKLHGVSL